MRPLVIINFKTYEQATGKKALELAKICDKVAKDSNVEIIIAVQATDLYPISQEVSIPLYAQHIDSVEYGANTGRITAQAAKQSGASGTLLNHSERRLRVDRLEGAVNCAKKAGLKTVICANDAVMGQAVNSLEPDFIAVEPPELIGGDISVSTAQPGLVREAVKRICGDSKKGNVLVGAGVKDNKDFKKSLKLGAVGVLLASGIAKSKMPEKALRELVKGVNPKI